MKDKLLFFVKGILMGLCDLIPGISGGTIAFITGIYERLMSSVKNCFSFLPKLLKPHKLKKHDWDLIDFRFLIPLGAGLVSAFLLGSRVVHYLLDNYLALTLSFFIGLILSSSIVIYRAIDNHIFFNKLLGLFGFIFGICLAFLIPMNPAITIPYFFMCGFFAIFAMFLPGISGSFILLILGAYETILKIAMDPFNNFSLLVTFVLAAICGAFTISRLIKWLFEHYKAKTLYFLLGIVFGALSIPIKQINQTNFSNPLWLAFLVVLGLIAGYGVTRLGKEEWRSKA